MTTRLPSGTLWRSAAEVHPRSTPRLPSLSYSHHCRRFYPSPTTATFILLPPPRSFSHSHHRAPSPTPSAARGATLRLTPSATADRALSHPHSLYRSSLCLTVYLAPLQPPCELSATGPSSVRRSIGILHPVLRRRAVAGQRYYSTRLPTLLPLPRTCLYACSPLSTRRFTMPRVLRRTGGKKTRKHGGALGASSRGAPRIAAPGSIRATRGSQRADREWLASWIKLELFRGAWRGGGYTGSGKDVECAEGGL